MDATQTNRERHYNEIRVFISSTFTDMDRERNYLVKHIFPDIRRKYRKRNVVFTPLDLRWGITEEESKSGRVVEICLDEIARTRPFFIGLVGGRYGWVPSADDSCFGNESFLAKYPWVRAYVDRGMSITEMEMQYGMLSNSDEMHACFFLKAENCIPPELREPDEAKERKRLHLKECIAKAAEAGKCRVLEYSDLSSLGHAVHDSLMALLDEVAPESKTGTVYDRYLLDQKHMLDRLRRCYYNISESVYDNPDDCSDHQLINGISSNRVTIVSGAPGSGVSALLANALPGPVINYCDADGKDHEAQVIHTIVSDEISSVARLKCLFLTALADRFDGVELPELAIAPDYQDLNFDELFDRFPRCEIIWVIDGAEKLPSEERNLAKILHMDVPGLKFVIGTADEQSAAIMSREYNPDNYNCGDIVRVEKLTPLAIRKISTLYLRANGKGLVERQLSFLTGTRMLETPRQLINLLDMMIQFGSYEKLDDYIGGFTTVRNRREFYSLLLEIMDLDFGNGALRTAVGRLLYSRFGWDEDDLTRDIAANEVEKAALLAALSPYCSRRSGQMLLKDSDMRQAAEQRYSFSPDEIAQFRKEIIAVSEPKCRPADRFDRIYSSLWRPLYRNARIFLNDNEQYPAQLATTEILHQQLELNDVRAVRKLMTHFGFLMICDQDLMMSAIHMLHKSGTDILRLIDLYDMYIDFRFSDGALTFCIYAAALNFSDNADAIRRRIRRLWLPKRYKKPLYDLLPSAGSSKPLLETWEADEVDRLSLPQIKYFAQIWDEVINADSKEWIGSLRDKVNQSLACLEASENVDETALVSGKFVFYRLLVLIALWEKNVKDLGAVVDHMSELAYSQNLDIWEADICQFRILLYLMTGRDYDLEKELKIVKGLSGKMSADLFGLSTLAPLAAMVGDDRENAVKNIVAKAVADGTGSARYVNLCRMTRLLYKLGKNDLACPVYRVLAENEALTPDIRMSFAYRAADCLSAKIKSTDELDYLLANRPLAFMCKDGNEPYNYLSRLSSTQRGAGKNRESLETAVELTSLAEEHHDSGNVAIGLVQQALALQHIGDKCGNDDEREAYYRNSLDRAKKSFDMHIDATFPWIVMVGDITRLLKCGCRDDRLIDETRQAGERMLADGVAGINDQFVSCLMELYAIADNAEAFASLVEKYNPSLFYYKFEPGRLYSLIYRGTTNDQYRRWAMYVLGQELVRELQDIKIKYKAIVSNDRSLLSEISMKPVTAFHEKSRLILAQVKDLGADAGRMFLQYLQTEIHLNDDGIVKNEASLATALVHAGSSAYLEGINFPIYECFYDSKLLTNYYLSYGLGRLAAVDSLIYDAPYEIDEFRLSCRNFLELFDGVEDKSAFDALMKEAASDFEANFQQLFDYVYEHYGPDAEEFRDIFINLVADDKAHEGAICRLAGFCRYILALPDSYSDFFEMQADNLHDLFEDLYYINDDEPFTYELWTLCRDVFRRLGTKPTDSLLIAALSVLDIEHAREIHSRYCDGTEGHWVNWNYAYRLLNDGRYDEALTIAGLIRQEEPDEDEGYDNYYVPDDNRFMRSLVYRAMGDYAKSWEVRHEPLPQIADEDGKMIEDTRTNCPYETYYAVGAILVGDYERAEREIELAVSYDELYDLIRCVMMLRVNNPVGELPVFEDMMALFEDRYGSTVADYDFSEADHEKPVSILLCISWRMLELARYKRRHGLLYDEELISARTLYDKVLDEVAHDSDIQDAAADFYFLKKEFEQERLMCNYR